MEEDDALLGGLGDSVDAHCNWVGSSMDRATAREGHARLALFNPRVMIITVNARATEATSPLEQID